MNNLLETIKHFTALQKRYTTQHNGKMCERVADVLEALEYYAEATKTTLSADIIKITRCKDCKHHEDEEIGMVYCPQLVGGWAANDWFCADGEEKK